MTLEASATLSTVKNLPMPSSDIVVERIYVGGLNPTPDGRGLKPSDVVQRLQSFCQASNIQIVSVNNAGHGSGHSKNNGISCNTNNSVSDSSSSSSSSSIEENDGEEDIDNLDSRPFVHINAVLLRDDGKDDGERSNSTGAEERQESTGDVIGRRRVTDAKDDPTQKAPSSTTSSTSALALIAKQFHNIKWKGCKIRVEAAMPHFLERLEDERKERMLHQQQQQQVKGDQQERQRQQQQVLPRKLRVRKRYGDEAVHVDTKPWDADSWQNFKRARTKLQKWADKDKQSQQLLQQHPNQRQRSPQPTVHRAVHIRFSEHDEHEMYAELNYEGDDGSFSSTSSSSSSSSSSSLGDSSDSGSESEEDDDEKRLGGTKKMEKDEQRFVWSDDDDDSHREQESEMNNDESIEQVDDQKGTTRSDQVSHDDGGGGGGDDNVDHFTGVGQNEAATLAASQDALRHKKSSGPYEWSSDDDDDDDDESASGVVRVRKSSCPNHDQLTCSTKFVDFIDKAETSALTKSNDEFMAGFDDVDDNDDDDDDSESNSGEGESTEKSNQDDDRTTQTNLVSDVNNNLNVLASIFPDMPNRKPATLMMEEKNVDENSGDEEGGLVNDQFSDGFGLMPRFDPTSSSSQKYVIEGDTKANDKKRDTNEEAESEDKKTTEDEVDGDEDDPSENTEREPAGNKTDTNDNIEQPECTATADVTHVYHEVKLEGVFREAREAWQCDATAARSSSTGGGGFSFGFDLGDLDNHHSNLSGSRQPDMDNDTLSTRNKAANGLDRSDTAIDILHQHVASGSNEVDIVGSTTTTEHENQQHRPRGLLLPKADLMQHVDQFFSLNSGEDVSIDPVGYYSKNKQDQEDWKKERLALTMDWKRKRRLAGSRHNKYKNKKR